MDYTTILEQILHNARCLSLATSDKNGFPWASPVIYKFSETECSFYFISSPDSRHIKNILENPNVAFSLYDSSKTLENAFGIQGSGVVREVAAERVPSEIRGGLLASVSMVVLNRFHLFYKLEIDKMYLPHAERWKEEKPLRIEIFSRE